MKKEVISWFSNIRFYVLVAAVVLAAIEYVVADYITTSRFAHTDAVMRWFAYTALVFLYLALLAGPFTKMAKWFPWRGKYLKARRSIGVSTFLFATLHVRYSLFDHLGGISALFSLPPLYLFGVILGLCSLVIVFLLAVTSFDKVVDMMTFRWWKFLHKFVYLAGFMIFFHVMIVGSTFADKTSLVTIFVYVAAAFLIGIHAYGQYKKRKMRAKRKALN